MSITYSELQHIVQELQVLLNSSRIMRVYQSSDHDLLLEFQRSSEVLTLYSCLKPGWVRMHLLSHKRKAMHKVSNLCLYMRKHLVTAKIEDITILQEDRIVQLVLKQGVTPEDVRYFIIAELFDKKANIFLLDSAYTILYSYHTDDKRRIGSLYQPPPKNTNPELKPADKDPETLFNQTLEQRYNHLYYEKEYTQRKQQLTSAIKKQLKKEKRLFDNLQKDYTNCLKADAIQHQGELLKSNFHLLKRGMTQVEVMDYSQNPPASETIALNPNKTPAENIAHYFSKAKKGKTGKQILETKIREIQTRQEHLQQFLDKLPILETYKELRQYTQSHKDNPYVKKIIRHWEQTGHPTSSKPHSTKKEQQTHRYFLSEQGVKIYVGRNNRDNAQLTFRFAKGNDTWLHCRDYPGSHVVIRGSKSQEIDQETLVDAAHLALFFSKAKEEKEAEVMITQRKYIGKEKNAPLGQVTISNYKVMLVSLDKERIQRIKEREEQKEQKA